MTPPGILHGLEWMRFSFSLLYVRSFITCTRFFSSPCLCFMQEVSTAQEENKDSLVNVAFGYSCPGRLRPCHFYGQHVRTDQKIKSLRCLDSQLESLIGGYTGNVWGARTLAPRGWSAPQCKSCTRFGNESVSVMKATKYPIRLTFTDTLIVCLIHFMIHHRIQTGHPFLSFCYSFHLHLYLFLFIVQASGKISLPVPDLSQIHRVLQLSQSGFPAS